MRTGPEWAPRAMLHEIAHAQLRLVDLDAFAVTAPLGRHVTGVRFGTIRPRGPSFLVGDEVFSDVEEAAAEMLVRYVLEPETLDRQRRRWVERTAARFGLGWLELARSTGAGGQVPADVSTVYRCGYCGHHWGEMGAAIG